MLESNLIIIIIFLVLFGTFSILSTVVFVFWSVFLFDAIRRKWKYYRNSLRCIQQGEVDITQNIQVYNAETELVKNIFLFFMNLVEWLAYIIPSIRYMVNFANEYYQEVHDGIYLQGNASDYEHLYNVTKIFSHSKLPIINKSLYLANICLVLGIILIACLCMYLAARHAQKSWITSNKIPFLISFFFVMVIIAQIISSICTTELIGLWCNKIIITTSLIIAWKQYKKLCMVINWSIVDLGISRNCSLLKKQIRMKKRFKKIFTIIWIGLFLIFISEIFGAILITIEIVFSTNNDFYSSLCEFSQFSNPEYYNVITIFFCITLTIGIIGGAFIFIPYIGFGLSTLCVILWRLSTGKTGYKTHYHNHMTTHYTLWS